MSRKYIAEFHPQAWINDYAVEVDHEGSNEWDCTVAFEALDPHYRELLRTDIRLVGTALDAYDALKDDPAAPEWVRQHRGPFDIYIREAV